MIILYITEKRIIKLTSIYEGLNSLDSVSRFHFIVPKLVKITSDEQRAEYARRFNSMYADYLELHTKIKEISGKALYLESQLNDCEKGSKDYELYKQAIMKIYKETALNYQYKTDWERFHVYQKTLEEIKKLVTEYDSEAS